MINKEADEYIRLKLENEELKEKIHHLQEEYEKYFIVNHLRKPNIKYTKVPLEHRYGAIDIVRNSLAYRLGSVVINNTRSIKKLYKLPFLILNEYQKPLEKNNINIEEFYDYNEAMKLKKHLSYRIGIHISHSLRNHKKIPSLPFKLIFELYQFKKDK